MKRVFIAIDIQVSKDLKNLILRLKSRLKDEKIRWVRDSNMHLTLAFLGDKDDESIEKTADIMCQTAVKYHPFKIGFDDLGVFNSLRSPRVLWLGLNLPDKLKSMREELCKKLKSEGIYFDAKPFRPHLTLGRMKYINDITVFTSLLCEEPQTSVPKQHVNEIILFESILKPDGPIYKKEKVVKLKHPCP